MCTIVGTETVPYFKFLWREGMSSQMSKIDQKARLHRMKPTLFTTKPLVGRKGRTSSSREGLNLYMGGLKRAGLGLVCSNSARGVVVLGSYMTRERGSKRMSRGN